MQDLGNDSASGRDLLYFCKSSCLHIVNGRVNNNNSGNFTCFKALLHYEISY